MFIYEKNAYEKIISVFCKNTHIHVKIIIKGQIQIIFSCCHLSI